MIVYSHGLFGLVASFNANKEDYYGYKRRDIPWGHQQSHAKEHGQKRATGTWSFRAETGA